MTRRVAALAVAALAVSGCGGGDDTGTGGPPAITVFAASSLTEALTEAGAAYRHHDGGTVTFSFAGSQDLAAQIEQGAPADVLATADTATMTSVRADLVDPPQTLARNRLVVVTAPGNPHHVIALPDLARDGIVVVLADPSVPAGHYAAQALGAAHVQVHARSLEPDVRAVLTKVEIGEADAGIVYATDAKAAGDRVSTVAVPQSPTATYEIASVSARGRSFVQFMRSAEAQRILRRHGFLLP